MLDALVTEKKITWSKSGRESAKREADLYKTLEKAASDEKEERDREKLGDKLEAFLKRKQEEDETTFFMEEMTKNVEASQHKSIEAEQRSSCSTVSRGTWRIHQEASPPKCLRTCEASNQEEEMNEDFHLDCLKALPRQDAEQTTTTWLNKENRQRIWGQVKVGFSWNSRPRDCVSRWTRACEGLSM